MPGDTIAVREVVEHYGAVAILAMDDDGNIPLIYQYRHALGGRLWELPAGLLDVADEPPHHTAARELQEEAGLQASTWQVLLDLDSSPGFSDEAVRVYLATGLGEIARPAGHHEEADLTLQWYSLAEATRMVFNGEIVNAVAVAGILAAQAVTHGLAQPRPLDSPWTGRPTSFVARKSTQ